MKKKMVILFLLISFTMIFCSCQKPSAVSNIEYVKADEKISTYEIEAELSSDNKTLSCTQTLRYINNDKVGLDELYFHVYPNAFKSKATAPFLFDDFSSAYKNGFLPGFADIVSVELIKGDVAQRLQSSLSGDDSTIMKVVLPNTLNPSMDIVLRFKYNLTIPPAGERFGYCEGSYNLGNWYLIAAVYDNDGWNLDKYYAVGDPFYSDVANYKVKLKAKKDYTIAASGQLIGKSQENDYNIWEFEGNKMRDFAFIASDRFEVAEDVIDGTKVKSYYYKGHKEKGKIALEYGIKSIETFNDLYGKYPYPEYSVVETEFPSGMEYPGLVYISDEYYEDSSDENYLIITVVHESAHQWWYSLVGNDQIDEAWIDEGFASYSETLFAEKNFGKVSARNYFNDSVKYSVEEALSTKIIDGNLIKSLDQFESWEDYGPTVYDGGAMLLDELREKVGDEMFFTFVKQLFNDYKYSIITTDDFIESAKKVCGAQVDEVLNKWLKK